MVILLKPDNFLAFSGQFTGNFLKILANIWTIFGPNFDNFWLNLFFFVLFSAIFWLILTFSGPIIDYFPVDFDLFRLKSDMIIALIPK